MDILAVTKVGLFIPFVLTLLVVAIFYLIDGYKKDFGKSLVSFIATIIGTIVSVLLAKLCAWGTAKLFTPLILKKLSDLSEEMGSVLSLASGFIQSAIDVGMSFLFFSLFFTISVLIFKSLGKKIKWEKLEKLNPGKTGTRIAGMGIRGIDALLVTVMLLLPLYGSISMAAPPVASLLDVFESFSVTTPQENESPFSPNDFDESLPSGYLENALLNEENNTVLTDNGSNQVVTMSKMIMPLSQENMAPVNASPDIQEEDISKIIDAVANHPVLIPYKYGPGSWIYSGLSSVSLNGNTINITAAVESVEKILNLVQKYIEALEDEDTEEALEIMEELIDYARNEVINQKWSYDIIMAFVGELDTLVETYADELPADADVDIEEMYDQLRPLLDMTYEEYTTNAEGLLDFASWFIETYGQYINEPLTDEKEKELTEEMYAQVGELLNLSDQAVSLKRMILQMQAQKMFDGLPDKQDPAYAEYYASRKNLPESGTEFVNEYFGNGIVSKKERDKEVIAMILLLEAQNGLEAAEAFVQHPLFGAQAVTEATDEYLYITSYEEYMYETLTLDDDSYKVFDTLDKMLSYYEDVQYDDCFKFEDLAYGYMNYELSETKINYGYYPIYDQHGNPLVIKEDENGKLYLVPEDLAKVMGDETPLTKDVIKENFLKPFEDFASDKLYESENSEIMQGNEQSFVTTVVTD